MLIYVLNIYSIKMIEGNTIFRPKSKQKVDNINKMKILNLLETTCKLKIKEK